MERLLLLGYFGAGNFGDDALLCGWLARHRDWMIDSGLVADISTAGELPPVAGFKECADLTALVGEAIPRDKLLGIDPGQYRALIIPGGSLLQDETSLKSLLFYLWIIRGFIAAGKPVYLLNQGIGPLRSWLARYMTPRYLQNTRMLSFRDRDSHAWARGIPRLAKHDALHLVCDPMLDPPFTRIEPSAYLLDVPTEYALFIPRPTGDLPYPGDETTEAQAMATLVKTVTNTTGLAPMLLPLHDAQDTEFCKEIQGLLSDSKIIKPTELSEHYNTAALSLISGATMVVSHRLHGLVSAVAAGVPVIGIAYDPKVISFCEEIGYPYCFPATAHQDEVNEDVSRLWAVREEAVSNAGKVRDGMVGRLHTAQEHFYDLW